VIPKNRSVASLVLQTSPPSNRPGQVSIIDGTGGRDRESTFYLCEDDATFLWLDGRGIEGTRILEDLCLVEVEQRPAVLVLLVKVHCRQRRSVRTASDGSEVREGRARNRLGRR
jgi:hypothetical protein